MEACPNCGHERDDRFCPRCGQNDRNYARSLWRLVADLFKETFEVDGRLPRTLRPMFLRPGQLAVEFSRNRRASYVSPVRSYLFASILFFFVLAVTAASPNGERAAPVPPESMAEQQETPERFAKRKQKAQEACADVDVARFQRALAPRQRRMMDEIWIRKAPTSPKNVWCCVIAKWMNLRQWVNPRHPPAQSDAERPANDEAVPLDVIDRFVAGTAVGVLHDPRAATNQLLDNLPLAMIVTLPAYALLLKVFFYFSGRYYTEHLVFAMQLHTFSFLVYTMNLLVPDTENLPGSWVVLKLLLFLWVAAYYYLALRRYYRNGRFLTAIKWLVLGCCYCVLLIPGLLLSVAVTLLFL